MDRILVVKLADLGDLLLCEPALRSLRLAYPNAAIDVLVPPASTELVRLMGHGLTPVSFDKNRYDQVPGIFRPANIFQAAILARFLRQQRYSAVILLHHLTTRNGTVKFRALAWAAAAPVVAGLDNGRGSFLTHRATDLGFGRVHECEYMLSVAQAAGGADVIPSPTFPVETDRTAVIGQDRFVAIHPVTGSYSSARTWPAERWADVASTLHVLGMSIVVVGASDARPAASVIASQLPGVVDLTGRTSIGDLARILKRATCVLGGDSFVGHLAAALGTPTVSVFGPSNSHAWRPCGDREKHRVVLHPMPCQPCIYTGYSLGRPLGCPDRTCLRLVTTGEVVSNVKMVCGAH
jgi:ADP-heptose:LPS heptosyltransferase